MLQGSLALGGMVPVLQSPSRSVLGRMLQPVHPFPDPPITSNFCEMKTKSVFCRHVPTFLSLPWHSPAQAQS